MLYNNLQADKAPKKGAGKQGKSRFPIYNVPVYNKKQAPIQAMFELAFFDKPVSVSFAQKISDNYAMPAPSRLISAGEYFLWDPSQSQKPGEYLIGLSQGFYKTDTPPIRRTAQPHFHHFLEWLARLWEKNRQNLISQEPKRMTFSSVMYQTSNNRGIPAKPYPGNYTDALLKALKPIEEKINIKEQGSYDLLIHPSHWQRIKSSQTFFSTYLFIYPKMKKTSVSSASEFRIYINLNPPYAPDTIRFLADRIVCNPDFCTVMDMKTAGQAILERRRDNTIIYLSGNSEIDAIVSVLTAFQKKHPNCFINQLPPMAEPKGLGIGVGETPQTKVERHFERQPFACSRNLAAKARTELEKKSAENSDFSAKAAEVAETMKALEELPAPFGDQVKSLPGNVLREIPDLYFQHFQKEFHDWQEMVKSVKFAPGNHFVLPIEGSSFLKIRSVLVSEALINTLHLSLNAFVCEVWRKFEEARINFFDPSRNLER
ncbi:MAG: T3SS effector HopA1 family protein [Cytophagales bacterium]|nr:T3SS effector HopA1 family protein [Cytophagales bacterium]